jgi:diguanylate cyclase
MSRPILPATAEAAAQAALAALGALGLPPDPPLFAVMYAHHLKRDAVLSAAVQALLDGGKPVTAGLLEDLHRGFFGGPDPVGLGVGLEDAATRLAGLVGHASSHATRFCALLGEAESGIARLDEEDLRRLTSGLLGLTRHLAGQTQDMTGRLEETERAIAELRTQLGEMNRAALTDALTGVGNRRAFEGDLASLLRPESAPASLVLLDLDRFKQLNDRWGHPVGDAVLRFLGARLREALRPQDRAARYGGEEFALLLPQTTAEVAKSVADRIRAALSGHDFIIRSTGERIGLVTVSAGIAEHRGGESSESLVKRADAALYAAKEQGRDRALIAPAAEAASLAA